MGLTPKQERFCHAIVAGEGQAHAYRSAYDMSNCTAKSVNELASRAMADVKIISRVEELRAPVVAQVQFGLNEALVEAEEARLMGKTHEQGGVMVAATTLKSKLTGLLSEKPTVVQSLLELAATARIMELLSDCDRRITVRQLEDADNGSA